MNKEEKQPKKVKAIGCYKLTKDTVEKFVNITSKYDFDVDVRNENRKLTVDGKSFVSVMNLDFSEKIVVTTHADSLSNEEPMFRELDVILEGGFNLEIV